MHATLVAAINQHLELEFNAFHQYHAMSEWLGHNDLPGFSRWLSDQSAEELDHAKRFMAHLQERDQLPKLPAIAEPKPNWENVTELCEEVLASEQKVTRAIEDLYELAEKVRDRAALTMLQWFITEQMEEENMAKSMLGRLNLVEGSGVGLLMIDQELSRGRIGGEDPAPEPAG